MLVLYLCVLIVFSLRRESLKLILVDEPLLEVVVSHKAIPSYYTKNKSFASGIFKVWCVCSDFHQRGGVFTGSWGSSTDLAEVVTHQVAADWPSHVAGRPGGTSSTALAFLFSCRHVSMMS
jgi:hypothetical protein